MCAFWQYLCQSQHNVRCSGDSQFSKSSDESLVIALIRLKAAPHWTWCASCGFRGGVILLLLVGLMGRLPVRKIVDLFAG